MQLELLAPAKNKNIGIAAIDCGADALYIAGPSFGAREAAGNSMDDIADVAAYARKFGAKVYMTVNTILYDSELEEARRLIRQAWQAGCDALIVQDLGILEMDIPPITLHASTQTDIRTVEKAKWLESLGFKRLILARELSLEQIREISSSVDCEVETFIHGALCVSYSGQCYMSCNLTGRSANRGACVQACRSKYDLLDEDGNVIVKDSPLLSLKDMMAGRRIQDLAYAGVSSFKIEGRLKNEIYVRNVVRYYSNLLDSFIERNPGYSRASSGRVRGGFEPDIEKTFNRGYTDFFLSGKRGSWKSGDVANSKGEHIGEIVGSKQVSGYETELSFVPVADGKGLLDAGDGVYLIFPDGHSVGAKVNGFRLVNRAGSSASESGNGFGGRSGIRFGRDGGGSFDSRAAGNSGVKTGKPGRADRTGGSGAGNAASGRDIRQNVHAVRLNGIFDVPKGSLIYRNYSIKFEKYVLSDPPRRLVDVSVTVSQSGGDYVFEAVSQANTGAGGSAESAFCQDGCCGQGIPAPGSIRASVRASSAGYSYIKAENPDKALETIVRQLKKTASVYDFKEVAVDVADVPFMPVSVINEIRRMLADNLDKVRAGTNGRGIVSGDDKEGTSWLGRCGIVPERNPGMYNGYRSNVSNRLAAALYESIGAKVDEPAYEISKKEGAELMRTKYCIRYEFGACLKNGKGGLGGYKGPLFLRNNGRLFRLGFDCGMCEMTVMERD